MSLAQFPALPGLTWPEKRSPLWLTVPQEAISGRRTRLQLRSYPQYQITLTYDILVSNAAQDWQTLLGFFNSVGGSAQPFLVDLPDDDTATNQLMGSGDGVTTVFQLTRSLGGFAEPVYGPTGTPVVSVSGVVAAPTVSPSGLVTFASPPAAAAPITWTGGYSWVCRFDDDTYEFERFMQNFWSLGQIVMTTEKP